MKKNSVVKSWKSSTESICLKCHTMQQDWVKATSNNTHLFHGQREHDHNHSNMLCMTFCAFADKCKNKSIKKDIN
jgi:hypothetical protein